MSDLPPSMVGGEPAPAPDPLLRSMFRNSPGMFAEPAPEEPHPLPIGRPPETRAPAPAAEVDPAKAAFPNSPALWQKPEQAAPTPASRPGTPMPATELPPAAGEMPQAYSNVVIPEGYEINPATFAPVARDFARAGMSREQVEVVLSTHAKLETERATKAEADIAAENKRWRQAAEQGLQPGDREALSAVTRAMPADVKQVLNQTGLGDHPALVRWMAQLGRRLR